MTRRMFPAILAWSYAMAPIKPTMRYATAHDDVDVQMTLFTLTGVLFSFTHEGTVTTKAKLNVITPVFTMEFWVKQEHTRVRGRSSNYREVAPTYTHTYAYTYTHIHTIYVPYTHTQTYQILVSNRLQTLEHDQ